jgi:O-antigen/teichoic acid export membrane protein
MVSEPDKISYPQSLNTSSLKSRVFRAGSWTLLGYIVGLFLRLGGTLVFTRLFTPEIFGIMAVAMAFHLVITLLADVGLRQAVIQSPNGENRSFVNTAWTLQVLRGWLIWSVCGSVAVGLYAADVQGWLPSDSVYVTRDLPAVIAAISFSAVIVGFQSMKAVIVNRALDLKRITLIELTAQIVSLLVVVVAGWATRSIWSLVVGGLVASALVTVLSHVWLDGPVDRFAWDRMALKELMHFGKWVFLSSALSALAINGDRLLLGGWVNPAMLGYYSIASNLATMVDGAANRVFGAVSLPALSEIVRRQPERLPALYIRMRRVTDAAMVGMAGFLFAAGEWIIGLMYDPRYAPAGWMLQWLSFGLLFSRYALAQNAYLALGRPSYVTAINITKLVSLFVFVPGLFYAFGVPGAILGIALHLAPTVSFVFWLNRKHGLNDVGVELAAIGMWPIGWLMGFALVAGVQLTFVTH